MYERVAAHEPFRLDAAMPGRVRFTRDSGGDFSLTNNQEAGVFEPDIVKTDGKVVYAVTPAGVLNVVDVSGAPKLIGSLPLPQGYGHQLLLYPSTDLTLASPSVAVPLVRPSATASRDPRSSRASPASPRRPADSTRRCS